MKMYIDSYSDGFCLEMGAKKNMSFDFLADHAALKVRSEEEESARTVIRILGLRL
jgi:hypothetical protein